MINVLVNDIVSISISYSFYLVREMYPLTLKKSCLTVVENFVYSGINNEFKQLGCMDVLA